MRYSIRTVTPAASPPLSTADAKKHLEVQHSDDDALIAAQVAAAVDAVERFTGQVLADCVMEMVLPGFPVFPEMLSIPREPVTEILSLLYTDSDGEEAEVTDFRWSESSPDVVMPAFRSAWPSAADEPGSVRLRFRAGYGPGLAPSSLIEAAKLLLGHFYANREAVVTGTIATEVQLGVQRLCSSFRRLIL